MATWDTSIVILTLLFAVNAAMCENLDEWHGGEEINTQDLDTKAAICDSEQDQLVSSDFHDESGCSSDTHAQQEFDSGVATFDFAVLHHPTLSCKEGSGVTVYVLTKQSDFRVRRSIRQTWARKRDNRMSVVFVLGGSDDNEEVTSGLEEEQHEWNDLLQFEMRDTYRNLARKNIATLKYLAEHCPPQALLAKIDADVYVNTPRLLQVVEQAHLQQWRGFHCRVFSSTRPIRSGTKWEVSLEEYPDDTYPPYCLGAAEIFNVDVARRIHLAALRTQFFWIDDVFVTGILREAANVAITRLDSHDSFKNFYQSIDGSDVNVKHDNVFVELRRVVTTTLWHKLHDTFTNWNDEEGEKEWEDRSARWTEP